MSHAADVAAQVARASYGRLLAILTTRTSDIAAAEDALADAFAAALRTWPERGVPTSPEAWLLVAAKRNWGKDLRHQGVQQKYAADVARLEQEWAHLNDADPLDPRLRLLFVCSHPGIAQNARVPLMLQTVLGLTAERIAQLFATSPQTMGQRLVRAKKRIRVNGIPFEMPSSSEQTARMPSVLESIYAAYNVGWHQPDLVELAGEAVFLAACVVEQAPTAEALGLSALLMFCESRRHCRFDAGGRFVPLDEQDPSQWETRLTDEAFARLKQATSLRAPGRFQTEAAIQSVHARRSVDGDLNVDALIVLYDVLVQQTQAVGALVGRAAAYGRREPAVGLQLLDAIAHDRVAAHQPYWAVYAHLAQQCGHDADEAFARAIALTTDVGVVQHLQARRQG